MIIVLSKFICILQILIVLILLKKISTTVLVDTTERKDLATTPTTDKTSELIAVIASTTGTVAILFVTVLIVVVICKRKRQSPKENNELIKSELADNEQGLNSYSSEEQYDNASKTETNALAVQSEKRMVPQSDYDAPKQIKSYKKSHTKEWKKIGHGKIYNRDDAFAFPPEDENIDS